MTTPEGRDPAIVLRADVAQYLASLSAAERATLRLATNIQRDMRSATTSINQATAALRAYVATAQTAGARIPAARTGGGASAAAAASGTRVARDAAGRFTAQKERADAALARASRQRDMDMSRSAERTADVMQKAAERVGNSFEEMAHKAKITAAVLAAGLFVSARAAIEWETAWTGVRKTVDGTPEQMAALERELRNLATTLPTTHKEIAGIAEAAGQMGIATQDIGAFTKTVVDLAQTTNLTADAAATGLAKFTNVMQTAPEDTRRLASTIVALGNAGASTEADILAMAQRLTGAGRTIGLTEDQVLALASAMSDVGIEAELGGGAMQRVMIDLFTAVQNGGEDLENLASIARGVNGEMISALDFSTLFNADPAAGFQAVLRGLRQISDEGGNVVAAMNSIGAEGTLDISVLTRLTGAIDTVNDALDESERAWRRPIALLEEAEKRYETTASKIAIARNQLKDLAIDVGGAVLPDVARGAGAIQSTANAAQELPGILGVVTLESAKAVAMLGLLLGAFALLAPKIAISIISTRALATLAPRLSAALGFLQRRFVLLAAAVAALGVADVGIRKWTASIDQATGRRADIVELRRSMLDLVDASKDAAKTGDPSKAIKATGEAARLYGDSLKGFAEDLKNVTDPSIGDRVNSTAVKILNAIPDGMNLGDAASNFDRFLGRANDAAEAGERMKVWDEALSNLVDQGLIDEAGTVIEMLAESTNKSIEEVVEGFEKASGGTSKYVESVQAADLQAEITARTQDKLAKETKKVGEGMNAAAVDTEEFAKSIEKVTPKWLDLDEALLKNQERWSEIAEEAEEAHERIIDATNETVDGMVEGRDRAEAYGDALSDLAAGAENSFDRIRDAATSGVDDALAAGAAWDGLATSIRNINEAAAKGEIDPSLMGGSERAIEGRQQVVAIAKQVEDQIKAQIPDGAGPEQVARIVERAVGDVRQSLRGFNPQVVNEIFGSLYDIPRKFAAEAGKAREEARTKALEQLGQTVSQGLEVAQSKIRPGTDPATVDAIVAEEARRIHQAAAQGGVLDSAAVNQALEPIFALATAYRDAQQAEQDWQQSSEAALRRRVEFGQMLRERLDALKAYNQAAQTNPNITAEDQANFAVGQANELTQQLGAMGATPEQIDQFTKPLFQISESFGATKPQVDPAPALSAMDAIRERSEATRIASEWNARPKVDTEGVKQGLEEITALQNEFLKSPAGQAFIAQQDPETQKILQGVQDQRDLGVAGGDNYGGRTVAGSRILGGAADFGDWITSGALGSWLRKPFAAGGFTGPGGKWDPAGIVHRGEFVFDQEDTRRWRPLFEAIHGGRMGGYSNGGEVRSYAGGGYAGPQWHQPPPQPIVIQASSPAATSAPGQSRPIVVQVPVYLDSRQIATATGRANDSYQRNHFGG